MNNITHIATTSKDRINMTETIHMIELEMIMAVEMRTIPWEEDAAITELMSKRPPKQWPLQHGYLSASLWTQLGGGVVSTHLAILEI